MAPRRQVERGFGPGCQFSGFTNVVRLVAPTSMNGTANENGAASRALRDCPCYPTACPRPAQGAPLPAALPRQRHAARRVFGYLRGHDAGVGAARRIGSWATTQQGNQADRQTVVGANEVPQYILGLESPIAE